MNKSIIYYTDNRANETILKLAQKYILEADLPIVSCSLRPVTMGQNTVLSLMPSYKTMLTQIITALRASTHKYVFFCEHDVLYHKSHFDFTPTHDDVFYYNTNVWRWDYPQPRFITYDRLVSLSGLCCNTELALSHFEYRLKRVMEIDVHGHEPRDIRKMGYEPGTKKKRRGGLTDDDWQEWKSEFPNIDIRHNRTFTKNKTHIEDFTHPPIPGWQEASSVSGWQL